MKSSNIIEGNVDKLEELITKLVNRQRALQRELTELKVERSQLNQELERVQKEGRETIDRLQSGYEEQIRSLREGSEESLTTLKREAEEQLEALKQHYEGELTHLQSSYEQEAAAMTEEFQAVHYNLNVENSELRERYERLVARVKSFEQNF